MSNETLALIIQTVKEMQQCGLSNSFIKEEVPVMFDLEISEDMWSNLL